MISYSELAQDRTGRPINNSEDILDSRDVEVYIETLRGDPDVERALDLRDEDLSKASAEELDSLEQTSEVQEHDELAAFVEEGEDYGDWQYGATLIRDSYFKTYAQELADDLGMIPDEATWPANCIDWDQAARELQMDYTSIEYGSVTYWMRS